MQGRGRRAAERCRAQRVVKRRINNDGFAGIAVSKGALPNVERVLKSRGPLGSQCRILKTFVGTVRVVGLKRNSCVYCRHR